MAYVRFSSDDSESDFYIYASTSGDFRLHLADRRRKPDGKPPSENPYNFVTQSQKYWEWSDQQMETIPISEAGASMRFNTLQECIDESERLIKKGFKAPIWMIPTLKEAAGIKLTRDEENILRAKYNRDIEDNY